MNYRRNTATAASVLLVCASLMIAGCGDTSASDEDASVTVQLPPAHPYRPAQVKPAFSEPLTGAARG